MEFQQLPKPIDVGRAENLSGQKCGNLTILYRVSSKTKTNSRWACYCCCGDYCVRNASDLKKGIGKCDSPHNHNSLVGKKFGKLMPIYRTDDYVQNRGWLYECMCECGNIKKIRERDFLYGATVSCECRKREYKDLTGQKIGKLTVLNIVENKRNFGSVVWLCQCECGNTIEVRSSMLSEKSINSCGCIKSIGERNIKNLLDDSHIPYEKEKSDFECRFPDTNKPAKFDFYIKNDTPFLLEFDGTQHEDPNSGFGKVNNNFLYIRNHDLFKNQWAWDNNIPMKRIPYQYRDSLTIDDIMSDRFLITPTQNPKWYPKKKWTYPYFSCDDTEVGYD